jgi:L-cysteine S-thiosulfotransferase
VIRPVGALLPLLAVSVVAAAEIAPTEKRSGYVFSSRETQAMQDDDASNPGFLWVQQGEALWQQRDGSAGTSCADCHGDAKTSMRGVAARYPVFAPELGRVIDLEQRIDHCRTAHQRAAAFPFESQELLALTVFVANQSRGLPIDVRVDAQARATFEQGRALYEQRQGQLNLSCSQCHDDNWGKQLAGNPIPQAHPTGYPEYRLEWQTLGSLRRRLRNCLVGMRAEPYPYDAAEYVALELFLGVRANGLKVETPAVRR